MATLIGRPLKFGLVTLALLGAVVQIGCARKQPRAKANDATAVALRQSLDLRAGGGGGTDAAALGDPTGFATLKGVFKVTGTPPAMAQLKIDKDTDVCSPGGKAIVDESVTVGPNGGLGNVLIYLASPIPKDDPKWEHESYQAAKTAEVLFDQKSCVFLSHVFAMRTTQKMKVKNSDPVGHNTNLDSKRGSAPGNFTVAANGDAMYDPKAPSPSPFPVSCSIHPWMKSWLMVSDNPYFAVTNASGEFEIANVPAGVPLEFRVWQEKASLQSVTVNGTAAKWPKGKLAIKLEANETKTLDVAVDAAIFQ